MGCLLRRLLGCDEKTRPRPDFSRLEQETATWLQDIREASDKAEAVACAEALAEMWRAELRRVT